MFDALNVFVVCSIAALRRQLSVGGCLCCVLSSFYVFDVHSQCWGSYIFSSHNRMFLSKLRMKFGDVCHDAIQ